MSAITFLPAYQERVWGGRKLETIYKRPLPKENTPYGESWDISAREEAPSLVASGEYEGLSLGQLWTEHRQEIFGDYSAESFPLLFKILDAQDDLSIQVHPPAAIAEELGGEPKTEMWYIAHAELGAKVYIGVKAGTTKESYEQAIKDGTSEDLVHSIEPKAGEFIQIPSGRLHAIGAGLLIYEIQQNSDTTYRVYDWGRLGLDGKPRELHVEESMRCIDFSDVEPGMTQAQGSLLVECPYYRIERHHKTQGSTVQNPDQSKISIITVVEGELCDQDGNHFTAGSFFLVPKGDESLTASSDCLYLQTTVPN